MITLSLDQLITPTPSGVTTAGTEPSEGTWFYYLLQKASELGLVTTSWQSGDPIRTLLAILAVAAEAEDVATSLTIQGQFLSYAASGTVQYTQADGAVVTLPVSPDPSDPAQNPSGFLTLLDALGQNLYGVTRPQATYASGTIAIANVSASTYGPYAVGTYHVQASASGATYKNRATLTIPPSLIAGAGGTVTNVTVGSTTVVDTAAAHGVIVGDAVMVVGTQGVNGLASVIAYVSAVTATSITLALSTTGAWTSGGNVYKCTQALFDADVAGSSGGSAVRAINTIVTTNNGTSCANLQAFGARDALSNARYADLCKLALAARSPQGAAQAYEYFALTALEWLEANGSGLSYGPVDSALATGNSVTGSVLVTVSSSTPASTTLGQPVTPGCTELAITNVTGATPRVVSTSANHNLSTGDYVTVDGVGGAVSANGTWQVTVTGATSFSLDGSVGGGAAYTAGTGVVSGGDLGQIYRAVKTQANPLGTALVCESALAFPVTIVASVDVLAAYADGFDVTAETALQDFTAALPVGGNDGTIPYLSVSGAITAAGVRAIGAQSVVREVTSLTVNGVSTDVPYPASNYVALVASVSVTVRAV